MSRLAILVVCACGSSAAPPKVDLKGSAAPTTSTSTLTPGVELAEVALHGFEVADRVTATISIAQNSITVSGRTIVDLQDGRVAPAELQGPTISKLAAITPGLAQTERVVLSVDRRVPYATVVATLATVKQAPMSRFGLLARAGAHVVMVPFTLPAQAPNNKAAASPPLQLVVSISKSELRLWSLSGLEGTLAQPRFAAKREDKAALEDLARALDEIVGKRFPRRTAEDDRTILVMAEGELPMQALAEVLGAVRASAEGKELFPDVMFSLGVE